MTPEFKVYSIAGLSIAFCIWMFYLSARSVERQSIEAKEIELLRKANCARVLRDQSGTFYVWQQSGYDDCIEYAYLWASESNSNERIKLANTHNFTEVFNQLRLQGVAIHNGPPGTVS